MKIQAKLWPISLLLACALPAAAQITPLVALVGGWAITSDLGESDQFSYGFSTYQYKPDSPTEVRGMFGGIIGLEWAFQKPYAWQSTLGTYRMAPFTVEGDLEQGVSLDGSTPLDYHYQIMSVQLLWENKLLFKVKQKYYPYVSIGLGVAFNQQKDYDIKYPANLIFTPFYEDNQTTTFTYSLGLGLDYQIIDKLRFGVGYRFADLGKASLGERTLDLINPMMIPGTLNQSHLYTQQIQFQLTYGS